MIVGFVDNETWRSLPGGWGRWLVTDCSMCNRGAASLSPRVQSVGRGRLLTCTHARIHAVTHAVTVTHTHRHTNTDTPSYLHTATVPHTERGNREKFETDSGEKLKDNFPKDSWRERWRKRIYLRGVEKLAEKESKERKQVY